MHEQQLVGAAQAVGLALAGDYFEEYVGQVCFSRECVMVCGVTNLRLGLAAEAALLVPMGAWLTQWRQYSCCQVPG